MPIVSAILTVFSYAINDCVVVFDRIRFEMDRPPAPTNPLQLRNTVNRAMVSKGERRSSWGRCLSGWSCPGKQLQRPVHTTTLMCLSALPGLLCSFPLQGLVTIRSLLTLAVVMVCSICLVGIGPEGLMSFALAITFGLLNAT